MTQTEISFIPRPRPSDLFKAGTQTYRLYDRLLSGPVTSDEIIRHMNIFNYTGRISDVREKLKPHLIRLVAKRVESSLFEYQLKDPGGC